MAKRCRLRRDKHHSRLQARVLTRQINRSLKQDRKERVAAARAEIEACLENHDLCCQKMVSICRRQAPTTHQREHASLDPNQD